MKPTEILRDLIAIPSVSSQSNLPVLEYARRYLAPFGWHFRELAYTDERGVAKANLIATRAPEANTAELALVCHTDTVPFDGAAANEPVERDGRIYGRGACDVKGFLACALSAIREVRGPVCLILTADEEIGCVGARKLVEWASIHPRYAIIGEPTGLAPAAAGKGYCLAEVTVRGREAHSAFPDRGESAIYRAARVIGQVEALGERLKAETCERFDPPYTTLNIGTIAGGTAKNVVPGECRMLLEWRPIPGQRPERVPEEITGAELRVLRMQPGFATADESRIVRTLAALSGKPPLAVSFGTEAPWIGQLGTECVVFGPGDMRVAHSRDEHVAVADLERCTAILRHTWSALQSPGEWQAEGRG